MRWRNHLGVFSPDYDTWVPARHLHHCRRLIDEYNAGVPRRRPLKARVDAPDTAADTYSTDSEAGDIESPAPTGDDDVEALRSLLLMHAGLLRRLGKRRVSRE